MISIGRGGASVAPKVMRAEDNEQGAGKGKGDKVKGPTSVVCRAVIRISVDRALPRSSSPRRSSRRHRTGIRSGRDRRWHRSTHVFSRSDQSASQHECADMSNRQQNLAR